MLRIVDGVLTDDWGTVFTDTVAVMVSKEGGFQKYGLSEYIERDLKGVQSIFRKSGYDDLADDLVMVELPLGVLTAEEICTLINYFLEVSALGTKPYEILKLHTKILKLQIKELPKFV